MKSIDTALERCALPAGERILCAVSGGADSVCLLHLLSRREELSVICAHFNHRLRGSESDRDEVFVRTLCAQWGIPFVCGSGDAAAYAAERGLSLETAARELRYAFLERAADEQGAGLIATAHTANDNAETVLLHLARGSGTRGLGGIPPRRGRIVRPLLEVTRQQVEAYLEENAIAHVEDSTNALDDAARNRLRHHAVPALESVNSAFAESVGRMCRLLRADEDYLSAQAEAAYQSLWDGTALDIPGLRSLPEALRGRVLRRAAGEGAEQKHLEALWELCQGENPSGQLSLPGSCVWREYERLCFAVPETPRLRQQTVEPGVKLELPEAGLLLRAELLPPGSEIQSSFNTFSFSYGNICGKLSVTPRAAGDSIAFRHRTGTHSLKKLMTDAKIPRRQREAVPVLRDEAGVLAVYGFGQAGRAWAEPDRPVLRVQIEKTEKRETENREDTV